MPNCDAKRSRHLLWQVNHSIQERKLSVHRRVGEQYERGNKRQHRISKIEAPLLGEECADTSMG